MTEPPIYLAALPGWSVLEEYSTPFPGFHLYYPQPRQASPSLRALVDHLRKPRRKARGLR